MATVALSRLRAMLAYPTGTYISSSLTSNGNAGGTTLEDTAIVKYDANTLKNRWVLLTSGTYSGQSRRISSVSSSTITVTSAFGGQVVSAVTYEVVPWDPAMAHAMLQQAMRTLYSFPTSRGTRGLYLKVVDETLITDNLLTNSSFETYAASAFTGWDSIGTPTLSQSTRAMHGTYSASIAATGAVEGIEQNILTSINRRDSIGKTLHVRGWTWDDAASSSRIRLTFDGSTYTNGTYNTGDGEWTRETGIDGAIPADLTEATISCEVASGETGLFDLVVAWIDPINVYTLPTSIIGGPYSVLYQTNEDEPQGIYLPYHSGVAGGRVLRLEGIGRLTVPTTDASTVEVDENRAELIVAQAAVYLYQNPANTNVGDAAERKYLVDFWQARVAELKESPGIAMHLPGADERRHWSTPPRDTRQLILVR